ncbi:MAG: hypothetical protein HY721_13290 [Planctomycetes bacterium]|nr:hypothetical protein [Planctomycetota bacterium]
MLAKYLAAAAVLVAALAFTVEKREARACTSYCGSAGTGCACLSCVTNSSISIDVLYSNVPTCKVNATAEYQCGSAGRLVMSTATGTPLPLCDAGTEPCTGTAWWAANRTIDVGSCPASWQIEIRYNDNCQMCAEHALVRYHAVTCGT